MLETLCAITPIFFHESEGNAPGGRGGRGDTSKKKCTPLCMGVYKP